MLEKLNYKKNSFKIGIQGNFRDGKDSMYFISQKQSWHITFVKVDGKIEEWVRKVVVVDGMKDMFISEVEFKYWSVYKGLRGVRAFLKKQKEFEEYKGFIYDFLRKVEPTPRSYYGPDFLYDGDSPF